MEHVKQELGACVTCGKPFQDESEILFGDLGHQCAQCMGEEDVQRTWSKGLAGAIAGPIVCGLTQFVFNPLWIMTIMCASSSVWALRTGLAGARERGGFKVSTKQEVGLVTSGIIGLVLTALGLLFGILRIAGTFLSTSPY